MKQEWKDLLVFVVLLVMKVLTTLRTGIDTYTVSQDWLNVLLLDGVFLALWFVLAYGGKGQSAMSIRPFAAVGAYIMYTIMLIIGWEAHVEAPVVTFGVRIAGGLVLAYDTWDYIIAWNQIRKNAMGRTLAEQERNLREKSWRTGYKDANKSLKEQYLEQSKLHLLADLESDTDYRDPLPILPPPSARKALPSGQDRSQERSKNVPSTFQEREVDTNRPSVIRRWLETSPKLPDEFTRKEFEDACGCAKTQAFEAITYGKSVGEVSEIGRALYRKVLVIDGIVKEDAQADSTSLEGF